MNWIKRDKTSIWHPFTPLEGANDPLLVTHAEGVYLYTHHGQKIIDAVSSWWVNLHGHAHPAIAEAISRQAHQLEHVMFAGFTHRPAIELAESLLEILPDNHARIFYSDNGSTAVEVALKLSFQYWHNQGIKKNKVIAIDGAYHGDTFGAMSVGERGDFTRPFFPQLFEVDFIDFPTPDNEDTVMKQFERYLESDDIAAFIYEPIIQGASGMRIYSDKLLNRLILKAQSKGVLCIADEVMTGFGRTGKWFAGDYLNASADMICLSKGLTGGAMALGATSCAAHIVDAFKTAELKRAFLHGHSYTANPMACAAGKASLDLLLTGECRNNIERIGGRHAEFALKIKDHDLVSAVRCLGTIFAMELETGADSSYFSEMRNRLYPFFIERGILLRPLGNLIYIIPPYIITNEELNCVYSAIEAFLKRTSDHSSLG